MREERLFSVAARPFAAVWDLLRWWDVRTQCSAHHDDESSLIKGEEGTSRQNTNLCSGLLGRELYSEAWLLLLLVYLSTHPAVGITGQPPVPHLVKQGTEDGPLKPIGLRQ